MLEPTADANNPQTKAGIDYPDDVAQLRAWFSTDKDCLDYLDWLRWPNGFLCPHCQGTATGRDPAGRYRCGGCQRRVSVTSGTIFNKTRIPLTVWFEVIWVSMASKSGVSAAHLHRVLPISSYQSAWLMLAKIRQVMAASNSSPLEGRVEVDETFLGGPRAGKTGRGAAGKTLVAGAIEVFPDGWGRARLEVIKDASAASLRGFIENNVVAGSSVLTDYWVSYPPALTGYRHERINIAGSGLPAHESLPAVHRLFSLVKRTLDGTYQGSWSAEHLQEYLDEFVFRFNRRRSKSRGLVFMRLLQRAVSAPPTTYRSLAKIAKPKVVHPRGVLGARRQPGSLDIPFEGPPWRRPR